MEFKEKLLFALEDREVTDKIREICSNSGFYMRAEDTEALKSQIEKLKADNSELVGSYTKAASDAAIKEAELSALRNEKESLSSRLGDAERELSRLKAENERLAAELGRIGEESSLLRSEHDKAVSGFEDYERDFGELRALYNEYMQLDGELRERLSGMINCGSAVCFLCSCSRYETLEGLWDFIKRSVIGGTEAPDAVSLLSRLFDRMFEFYNEASFGEVYKRCEVSAGDPYDDEFHIRGSRGSSQGRVRAVELRGYYSAATRKIIRKSVVIAE